MFKSASGTVTLLVLVSLAIGVAIVLRDGGGAPSAPRAALEAHVERLRRELPADLDRKFPTPWSLRAAQGAQREAWFAFLDANEHLFEPLDALHADPFVTTELLTLVNASVADSLSLRQARVWTNLVVNRALLDLQRQRGPDAVERFALALELALLTTGDERGWSARSAMLGATLAGLDTAVRSHAWDRERAWTVLAPRLRAHEVAAVAYRGPLVSATRAVTRRVRDGDLDLAPESASTHLAEFEDRVTAGVVTLTRLALLTLAADRYRTTHGRWPATLADLNELVDSSTTECPYAGSAFTLGPGATADSLRVGAMGTGSSSFVPFELVR